MTQIKATAGLLREFAQIMKNERERFVQVHTSMDAQLNKLYWDDPVAIRFRNRYKEELEPVKKKLLPAMMKYETYLLKLAQLVDKYIENDSSRINLGSSGGVGNTVESSYSLSALRSAAINAGVVGVARNEKSGDATATGKTNNDSGKNSTNNKRKGARSGKTQDSSISATGTGFIAGGVASLSTGILLYCLGKGNNGSFIKDEISRTMEKRYGTPSNMVNFLPPEEQAQYKKDYNDLSKAVEEDIEKQYKEIYDNCWKEMGKFSYEDVYNQSGMTKQQFIAITAEMTHNNNGVLPLCSMSDKKYYYFYAQNSNEVYKVAKNGSEMFRIPMQDNYNYTKNFKEGMSGYAEYKRDPKEMMFWETKEDAMRYKINKDGSNRYIDIDFQVSDKSNGILNPKVTAKLGAKYTKNEHPYIYFEKHDGQYVSNFKFGRTDLSLETQGSIGANVSMEHKGVSVSSDNKVGYKTDGVGVNTSVNSNNMTLNVEAPDGAYIYLKEKDGELSSTGLGGKKNLVVGDIKGGLFYDREKGLGLEGKISTKGPVKASISGDVSISNIDANMSTHDGRQLLSQFSPEFERQIIKEMLADKNIVQHYEETSMPRNAHSDFPVVSYRATNEEQAKMIAKELEKAEQIYRIRQSMNNYQPPAEIIDVDKEIADISEKLKN